MPKRYAGGIISATRPTITQSSSSGMFSASEAVQYTASGVWAARPGAPTGVTGALGNMLVAVSFTPPVNNGGSAITSYTVTSTPGNFTASGASSPLTVTGLTNGTSYTFTVTATNSIGTSVSSSPSSPVIPSDSDFIISPAVSGITNWRFSTNGSLSIASAGEYTLSWLTSSSRVVKMWGGGGQPSTEGNSGWGNGSGGGAAVGTVSFVGGSTYILRIGNRGSATNAYGGGAGGGVYNRGAAGGGGGYTGIFLTSVTQANAILMAGGGGGGASSRADSLGGRPGNAGGGTTGVGAGDSFNAGGGTQSAGGTGANAGSALQGGAGSGGGGGGGGGYFGGGGGGVHGDGGAGGGGGSGYFKPSIVSSATLYQGSGTTVGNSSDADKPTSAGAGAGTGGNSIAGALVIKA